MANNVPTAGRKSARTLQSALIVRKSYRVRNRIRQRPERSKLCKLISTRKGLWKSAQTVKTKAPKNTERGLILEKG